MVGSDKVPFCCCWWRGDAEVVSSVTMRTNGELEVVAVVVSVVTSMASFLSTKSSDFIPLRSSMSTSPSTADCFSFGCRRGAREAGLEEMSRAKQKR